MDAHPLDRAVWEALSTQQRDLAQGDALARRYPAIVAPFAATPDDSDACHRALLALLAPNDRAALFTMAEVGGILGAAVVMRDVVDQMVLEELPPRARSPRAIPLRIDDVPAMLELVATTRPGPFGPRTIEMGSYLGIRIEDRLIAMTGERMRLDGFTEISAVCVDPSHRGQGFAAELVDATARAILARGDVPFLHVFASNASAAALYRKLGFVHRRRLHLAIIRASAGPADLHPG